MGTKEAEEKSEGDFDNKNSESSEGICKNDAKLFSFIYYYYFFYNINFACP